MIRRRFMQLFGLVPSVVVLHQGIMDADGMIFHRSMRDDPTSTSANIYMYGRLKFTDMELAQRNKEVFVKGLDEQLGYLRRDSIKYYDAMLKGSVAVSQDEDGKMQFVGDLI